MASDLDAKREIVQAQEMIRDCLAGNEAAVRQFQECYGRDVYHHPIQLYRLSMDDAADFYIFAFEGGRIFRRLRTYAGRAPFRSYLCAIVLDHLVCEWRRTRRSAEVLAFGEVLAEDLDREPAETQAIEYESIDELRTVVEKLPQGKALLLKLLHADDYDFTSADYAFLATASGRTADELVVEIEALRAAVRQREQRTQQIELALETVQRWIECYELQIRSIALRYGHELHFNSEAGERLADAEDRLKRRIAQREKLIEKLRQRKQTTPYGEIARLLNASVGTVSAQITRLRQELRRLLKPRVAQE